tara:strand:- start:197 stop:1186 length:990 start_codon:yes stop_codon:yes gene_type:complete
MKILVTGGAGFIASFFIKLCLKVDKNIKILNIDKLGYASDLQRLKEVSNNKNYFFKKINICNLKKVEEVISQFKPDILVNFAAESHVDNSINKPNEFINSNIYGTFNLLSSVIKVRSKLLFVHISTDEVYGSTKKGGFKESDRYNPSSPYSASKASSDMLVNSWNKTFGLKTLIINSTNNYGPYQFPEKLIPVIICNALQGKSIPIYGDGRYVRDWIHVQDNVECIFELIQKKKQNEQFNIGAQQKKNNLWIVNTICDLLEKLDGRSYKHLIKHVKDRLGHDRRYSVNTDKVRESVGWSNRISIKDGLESTVNWYYHNQKWWRKFGAQK